MVALHARHELVRIDARFRRGVRAVQVGLRASLVALLVCAMACASSPPRSRRKFGSFLLPPDPAANATRYRLQLRNNPVDPGAAFRCYGACQSEATPRGYLDCLSACPGFEVAEREVCAKDEVPPVAACFTVRKIPAKSEPPTSMLVLAVIGSFLLVIGAESLCASSKSQCGYRANYPY